MRSMHNNIAAVMVTVALAVGFTAVNSGCATFGKGKATPAASAKFKAVKVEAGMTEVQPGAQAVGATVSLTGVTVSSRTVELKWDATGTSKNGPPASC